MSKHLPEDAVHLACSRHGVVTAKELQDAGLSEPALRRRIAAGDLVPMVHGVAVVASLLDDLSAVAAVQLRYPDVIAERRTAASIWRLDGCSALALGDLELVRSSRARVRARGLGQFRRADIPDKAVTTTLGLRLTTPTWTLGELGSSQRADVDLVELALESALHLGLTTEARLHNVTTTRRGTAWLGSDLLAEALCRRSRGAPPTESYAETRFLQSIVRPLGLEDPERQSPIWVDSGRRQYRRDFVFREARELDVEIDGLAVHGTPDAHDHDTVRDRLIRAEGCEVVRFAAWRMDGAKEVTRRALLAELRRVG